MDRGGLVEGAADVFVLDLFDPIDEIGHPLVDAGPHQFEDPHPLALVLHLRIDLRVAAQADAAPQVVHRKEVILPGVVEDLEHDRALHPLHLLAAVVAAGVAPRAGGEHLSDHRVGIGSSQPLLVEIGPEPVPRPGHEAGQVDAPHAVGLTLRIVAERGHHRVFDLAPVVHLARLGPDLAPEAVGIPPRLLQVGDLLPGELRAEPPFGPAAGAADAEIVGEEAAPLGEVEAADGGCGALLEELRHLVAADPLQVAVGDAGLPPGVGEGRQR